MLVREERVFLGNLAKDYFGVELFLFYLSQGFVCYISGFVIKLKRSFSDWL